jgi:3-deoxy-D-manno-octulosonate 8-phosphate phosphatase (KDO 8-P phosphatase)
LPASDNEIQRRAAEIRMILLDVDGVLTDGKIYLGNNNEEFRAFFVRDGLAIRMGQSAGLRFGILSGRDSPLVERRARELDIEHVHQGIQDKGAQLNLIATETGLKTEQICFVGDDLIDVPALRLAGLAACPADGCEETRQFAHYICNNKGGHGAVREVVDLVLRASGRWDKAMQRFLE